MNETDRRVIRTRQAILDALVKLALEFGFEAITIRDIAKEANISYSTFFRHFKSIEELTTYAFNLARERIYAQLDDNMTPYDEALAVFSYINRHRDIFMLYRALPRDHPAVAAIRKELAETIESYLVADDESVVPVEAIAHHTSAAMLEMFRWWLENDSKYSVEQMATIYYELIVKVKLERASYKNIESVAQDAT